MLSPPPLLSFVLLLLRTGGCLQGGTGVGEEVVSTVVSTRCSTGWDMAPQVNFGTFSCVLSLVGRPDAVLSSATLSTLELGPRFSLFRCPMIEFMPERCTMPKGRHARKIRL